MSVIFCRTLFSNVLFFDQHSKTKRWYEKKSLINRLKQLFHFLIELHNRLIDCFSPDRVCMIEQIQIPPGPSAARRSLIISRLEKRRNYLKRCMKNNECLTELKRSSKFVWKFDVMWFMVHSLASVSSSSHPPPSNQVNTFGSGSKWSWWVQQVTPAGCFPDSRGSRCTQSTDGEEL